MKNLSFVGAAVVGLVLSAGSAQAQALAIPAEFPPASYTGTQYVDSRGCAFVRAGLSGTVNWVPRVDRTRTPLCNFVPTQIADRGTGQRQQAPNPLSGLPSAAEQAAAEGVVVTPAPVATPARAPAARTNPGAPIETVASLTTAPRLIQPAATATGPAPTPRVVTAAPAPVAAPQPPRITLAQVCDGQFGLQRGFVSASTGQPIDCGPAPAATAVVPARVLAAAAPAAPEVTGPRRLTLAQACAEISATGQDLINAATGLPVVCARPAPPVLRPTIIAAAPAGPAAPAAPAAPAVPSIQAPVVAAAVSSCANVSSVGAQYLTGGTGLPVRCGPQTQAPVSRVEQVTRRATAPAAQPLFGPPPVPASNPVGIASAEPIRPPAGYERVWGDGRLNPHRGLPRAQVVQEVTARVSSRSVTPQVIPSSASNGHRYVQIGTFRDAANAQRTTQQFQSMGLPVAAGQAGGGLQVIAIGPFGDAADLQRALQAARGVGFADAFTRN